MNEELCEKLEELAKFLDAHTTPIGQPIRFFPDSSKAVRQAISLLQREGPEEAEKMVRLVAVVDELLDWDKAWPKG